MNKQKINYITYGEDGKQHNSYDHGPNREQMRMTMKHKSRAMKHFTLPSERRPKYKAMKEKK